MGKIFKEVLLHKMVNGVFVPLTKRIINIRRVRYIDPLADGALMQLTMANGDVIITKFYNWMR